METLYIIILLLDFAEEPDRLLATAVVFPFSGSIFAYYHILKL